MTSPGVACPRCSAVIPSDAPGALCLLCLLKLGVEPPLPRAFGKYELRRQIGSGGMGIIFEAQEHNPNRRVALKMIRSGELASPEERESFRREAQEASQLEHRNIVTIFHVGDADEPAYYTMRLMTGGTLGTLRERDPRRVAQLVATVARAVHHGHTRGILHRDLKPANVLLDEEGEPHVADFGIARRLDDAETSTGLQGTPHYMSPEQAGARPLTTKSDVYSLGVILFELLSGQPPFTGATAEEVLEKQRTAAPGRLPSIDPDLEAICLRALGRDPELRGSAEQLADDLDRFLEGDAVAARPLGAAARGWRWCRRHPAAAGSAASGLLLALTVSIAAISIARAHELERRQDVLKANALAASSLAGLALFELSQGKQVVERLAANPSVVGRLNEPAGAFDAEIEALRNQESFATITLQDTRGMAIARAPLPPVPDEYFAKPWGWTDHFKQSRRRGEAGLREAHVGRASRSEATGDYKFTISAPVFAPDGGWGGAVYASFATDSVLGGQPLPPGTALIARPDNLREAQAAELPRGYLVVVHERLKRGESYAIESKILPAMALSMPGVPQLSRPNLPALTDDDYRDPVPGFEGRWLAGIAPVGNTDYAIVAQTRYAAVFAPDERLAKRLLWWVGLPFTVGALMINLLLFVFRRRVP